MVHFPLSFLAVGKCEEFHGNVNTSSDCEALYYCFLVACCSVFSIVTRGGLVLSTTVLSTVASQRVSHCGSVCQVARAVLFVHAWGMAR